MRLSVAAKSMLPALAGEARGSCAKRKNAIPPSRQSRDSSLYTREPFDCVPCKKLPLTRELSWPQAMTEGEMLAVSSIGKFMLTETLSPSVTASPCHFSLRLGHLAALTCHWHVIHSREAASLPHRGRFFDCAYLRASLCKGTCQPQAYSAAGARRPQRYLSVRMRATLSSMRASVSSPLLTACRSAVTAASRSAGMRTMSQPA